MKARLMGALKFDGLTVVAGFLFLVYIAMSVAWCRRYNPGHLLWFCDVALLLTAVGLFLRSGVLVTAQLVAILVFHLAWNLDFWLLLLFGYLPFDSTAYMFFQDLSLFEKSLSFFSHVFLVPAALYGAFVLGSPKRAWLVQWAQTLLVFTLTYLLTRPEENINRVFGMEVFNLSPMNLPAPVYYALMVTALPLLIYLPTNRLLTALVGCRGRGGRGEAGRPLEVLPGAAQSAVKAPSSGVSRALATAIIIPACAASVAVTWVADRKYVLGPNIFEVSGEGVTRLESLRTSGVSMSVDHITYKVGESSRRLPLLVWPHPTLPKQWSGFDNKLHAHTKSVLLEVSADEIPSAPQEVSLRGARTARGSVVWAYVASDDFYLQSYPDLHGYRDTYEVRCKIGGRGLSEYVDPATGKLFAPTAYSEILGNGTGAIYALGVIEVVEGEIVATSSYYLVKRRGLRAPEDIWFVQRDGNLTPLLSKPTDPVGSRVAFQSPLRLDHSAPEVFTCDFYGYDLRNLSDTPDVFDGFMGPGGEAVDSAGWLDSSTLQYYTEREGNVVRAEIKDRD